MTRSAGPHPSKKPSPIPPHSFVRVRMGGRDRFDVEGSGTVDEIAWALKPGRRAVNMTGVEGRFDYKIDAISGSMEEPLPDHPGSTAEHLIYDRLDKNPARN